MKWFNGWLDHELRIMAAQYGFDPFKIIPEARMVERKERITKTYITEAGSLKLTETEDQGCWLYSAENHAQIKVKVEDLIQLGEALKAARTQ